jgi:hypothetical protein
MLVFMVTVIFENLFHENKNIFNLKQEKRIVFDNIVYFCFKNGFNKKINNILKTKTHFFFQIQDILISLKNSCKSIRFIENVF